MRENSNLKREIGTHLQKNLRLERENLVLENEVRDLKLGTDVIERRAREDLGFVKSNEVFYQFVDASEIETTPEKKAATRE